MNTATMAQPIPLLLPRFELLSLDSFEQQSEHSGYSTAGLEHLVAIDRLIRSLLAGHAVGMLAAQDPVSFGGWVIAGSSALHGVYLRPPRRELRAPHELCLAPLSEQALDRDALAAALTAALPEGVLRTNAEDPERYNIEFTGTLGPAVLPLRLERRPLTLGRSLASMFHDPVHAAPGYLADTRLPYYSGVAAVPLGRHPELLVPVAYAEEVLLRLFSVLAVWPREPRAKAGRVDDRPALVDDVRLLSDAEFTALRQTIDGAVRAGISRKGDGMRRTLAASIVEQLRSNSDPMLLPAYLRSANYPYTVEQHRAFLGTIDELFNPLLA